MTKGIACPVCSSYTITKQSTVFKIIGVMLIVTVILSPIGFVWFLAGMVPSKTHLCRRCNHKFKIY